METVFIKNLPKGTTNASLISFFSLILEHKFIVTKTKNKGKRVNIHGFLQFNILDYEKIYNMDHFLNGNKLEIKEYIKDLN